MARKSIDWMKTMPELLNEWNYEKNNIMPSDISIWSKNKVWWKCKYAVSYTHLTLPTTSRV